MGTGRPLRWALVAAGLLAGVVGGAAAAGAANAVPGPPTTLGFCPGATLVAMPSHAAPGARVDVTGSGYPALDVYFDFTLGGTTMTRISSAWNVDGDHLDLLATVVVPEIPAGQQTLAFYATSGGGAPFLCTSTSFTVDAPPPTSTTTAAATTTTMGTTTSATTTAAPGTTGTTAAAATTTAPRDEPITTVPPTTPSIAETAADRGSSMLLPVILAFAGGVAAVLLVGLGWWLARRRYAEADRGGRDGGTD